jgi:archaellum component FlaC
MSNNSSEVNGSGGGNEGGISLGDDAKEILKCVFDSGGEATTSEVKQDTGLSTDTIRYRCYSSKDALADKYGLVQLSQVDPSEYFGNGFPPKRIELTEKGRQSIEQGLVSAEIFHGGSSDSVSLSMGEFERFDERLGRLENRVNSVLKGGRGGTSEGVESEVAELREEFDMLVARVDAFEEEYVEFYEYVANSYGPLIRGIVDALDDEGIDVNEHVDVGEKEQSVLRDFKGE